MGSAIHLEDILTQKDVLRAIKNLRDHINNIPVSYNKDAGEVPWTNPVCWYLDRASDEIEFNEKGEIVR